MTHRTGMPTTASTPSLTAPPSRLGKGWTVRIVECTKVADQLGLGEGGRLLVAILRSGHEGLERGQGL
jgi:hypothetical protein